jgi:hypothetical protein
MFERRALDLYVDRLRPRGFELCLRLRHVHVRSESALEPSLRKIEGFLVRHDRGVQKLFLRVKTS